MEARYAFRKTQLLDECQVASEIFEQIIPRLYTFMKPFVTTFQGQVAEQHAKTSVCGLLSNLERTNIESIAYRFGHSRLPCKLLLAGMRGTMSPCALHGAIKSSCTGTRRWCAGG